MSFKVTNVIDGDTFDVSPKWEWDGKSGHRIRVANLNAPELGSPGGQEAKRKLQNLIEGKQVELKNPATLSYGRLVCDVYYNGKNIISQL